MHLVTGGSGFLGNLVARTLHERGEQVCIYDLWKDPSLPQGIRFIQGDILEREHVASAMKGIHTVHHCAALNPLARAKDYFRSVNVEGSSIVAQEAVAAEVESFVHISSSAIFGNCRKFPILQETPPAPIEIYGHSKLAAERVIETAFKKAPHIQNLTLRPRVLIGAGRLGIFSLLFSWVRDSVPLYIIGNGKNHFQFLHPKDLISAYFLLLDKKISGTFNIGTDAYGTIGEALEHLITSAGSKSRIRHVPSWLCIPAMQTLDALKLNPLCPFHYLTFHRELCFDMSALQRLGWRASYSNDSMLQESYDWFLQKGAAEGIHGGSSLHRSFLSEKILKLVRWLP